MTRFADLPRTLIGMLAAALLGACTDDVPTEPTPPTSTACDGVPTEVLAPAPLAPVIVSGASLRCFAMAGSGRSYLVFPQLTGAGLPYGGYGTRFGDVSPDAPIVTSLARTRTAAELLEPPSAQLLLDAQLRAREHAVARGGWSTTLPTPLARADAFARTANDTLRQFRVLATLDQPARYARVTARLQHTGARVLLYVDTLVARSFTASDIAALGAVHDALTPAITSAFGDGSDIDGNGRVIFLVTPTVNALVPAANCATSGVVRGFFDPNDLGGRDSTSNRAEIFYAYAPDEMGRWSCRQPKADVMANLPPTFVHELQHMLSYGEHVVERGGAPEEAWLNEALSHMAEEIGSLVFEARYPAPAGRSSVAQLFPDSAGPFITPNVSYSYRFLLTPNAYSLTGCAPGTFCTLAERGGSWLMLRWLADQHGAAFLRRLVETSRVGRANLEAASARPLGDVLAKFAMAVHADSLLNEPRTRAPVELRFSSRNLRTLYRALFETVGLPGGVGRPFPNEPSTLPPGTSVTPTMRPGTFQSYRVTVSADRAVATMRFVAADGTAFPETFGAQVAILRLP
jgi:hypothetical protein